MRTAASARRRPALHRLGAMLESYSMVAPAYMIFLVFIFVPVVWAFYLSFFKYSILSFRAPTFVGLGNFKKLLSDRVFWIAVKNTVTYTLGTVPVRLVLGLLLALVLDQEHLRFRRIFRAICILPVATSRVASSISWALAFSANADGPANLILGVLGISPKGWLADSRLAMLSVCIMSVWKDLGYVMTIFTAGLQGIPLELYESAAIDGATPWKRVWHITIPLLKPTTFFILVTQLLGSFQVFTQTYVMTSGGPGYSTTTLINLLHTKGFIQFDMGYASALAVALFVSLLVLSWILRRVFKAEEIVY